VNQSNAVQMIAPSVVIVSMSLELRTRSPHEPSAGASTAMTIPAQVCAEENTVAPWVGSAATALVR